MTEQFHYGNLKNSNIGSEIRRKKGLFRTVRAHITHGRSTGEILHVNLTEIIWKTLQVKHRCSFLFQINCNIKFLR